MATLEIDLDATLIVSMVRALNTFCMERSDLLSEIIYEHGETFAEVAGSVDALRCLENAAADRDLTDAEDAALHKARSNGGAWMRRKAGQILTTLESPLRDDRSVCDASSVDDRPGQDAGAALVGVECYVQTPNTRDGCAEWRGPITITEYRDTGCGLPYAVNPCQAILNGCGAIWFAHARPVYLGLPEVTP